MIGSMSGASPQIDTGMTALVRGVILRRRSSGEIVQVSASTSANTGTAPACRATAGVEKTV